METPASQGNLPQPPAGAGGAQQNSLDTLRTVEFRQTLRGYHIDDVDDYLERVAVDAEALQEQLRLSTERLRQAAERIQALEAQLVDQAMAPLPAAGGDEAAAPRTASASEEALQKTLLLAQKFVEQTQSEAQAQAQQMLADAESRSVTLVAEAEERVRNMREEAERDLRREVLRLERIRSQLDEEVHALSRHLESERGRLHTTLSDMMAWLENQVAPVAVPPERETANVEEAEPEPPGAPAAAGSGESAGGGFASVGDDAAPAFGTLSGTEAAGPGTGSPQPAIGGPDPHEPSAYADDEAMANQTGGSPLRLGDF